MPPISTVPEAVGSGGRMPCLSGLYEIEINVQIWGFLFGVAGLYWNLVLARTVRNEMAGWREYPGK